MTDRVECKACGAKYTARKDGLPRGHGGPVGSECRSPTVEGQRRIEECDKLRKLLTSERRRASERIQSEIGPDVEAQQIGGEK